MDVLNFEEKGTLLEAFKNELGDGKRREISVNFEPRPCSEYLIQTE